MLTAIAIFFAVVGTGWFVLYCLAYLVRRQQRRRIAKAIKSYFERAEKEEQLQRDHEQNNVLHVNCARCGAMNYYFREKDKKCHHCGFPVIYTDKEVGPFPGSHDD